MIDFNILKQQLEDFFEQSKNETFSLFTNEELSVNINKSVYELENHLNNLKQKYKVNENLNTGIISDNILRSFKDNSSTFFRSNHYALSFLIFLTTQENHNAEDLLKLMHKYIDIVKEKLTFHDIVKTETGVTRCFTNIRFTLNDLRNFGLVYNKIDLKRSIQPTPVGYLISLYVNDHRKFDITKHLPENRDSNYFKIPCLSKALQEINKKTENFIDTLIERYGSLSSLSPLLKEILEDYCNDILKHIDFSNDGLKVNEKELEKSKKIFYSKIVNYVELSNKLKSILLNL